MEKRNTVQRELVLGAVRKLGCHATADEIYAAVSAEYPAVSKGTVYRNLNVLCEEGKILRVEVPGGADHYDHNTFEHCHVHCVLCGRVFDVTLTEIPDMMKKIEDSHGIRVLECELGFKGICFDCAELKQGESS